MKQITINSADYTKLFDLVKWYGEMPDVEVGDRFHENVAERIDEMLPTVPEIESDDYYSGGVEIVCGDIIWTLVSNDDFDKEIKFMLVPEMTD